MKGKSDLKGEQMITVLWVRQGCPPETVQITAFREQIRLAEDIEKRTGERIGRLRSAEKEEAEKGDILR